MSRVRRYGSAALPLLVLCLALTGCQVPKLHVVPSPSPGARASTSVDQRVLAVDAKLYGGDYDGAEAAYRSLAAANVPGAASHLSTLLAYENRFEAALTEAQAGVELRADSDSYARLARVLDWSEDVDGAVAAGQKAIAARPVETLAYVFYSEALADAGRFGDAQKALHTAEGIGGDAYVQAEIDREWSNLAHALGDLDSQLNYTELATKAQPRFPERQLDLIRFDYGDQRPEEGRALTDKLLSAHGQSYRMLVAVADAALVGGDASRAPALYSAAAQVQPSGAEAALGLAEIAVALRRDFATAHDLLLSTLKLDPTSSDVYQYLSYLDLLVLKRDPAPELNAVAPQQPAGLAAIRKSALDTLNGARGAAGVPALVEDPALDQAAQAHAYFFLFNASQQQLVGTGLDMEDASLPGFTGATAIDRDHHFGFTGAHSAELANHVLSAAGSMRFSIDSVFHRLPVVDRETTAVGYGQARVGSLAVSVLDVGVGPAAAGNASVYPADGQTDVPVAFVDAEVPDPLPTGTIAPTGYPVSLQVGGAETLAVTSGRLLGPDGKEVPSYTFMPGDQLGPSQWALVPKQPLDPGAKYTVDVTGTVNGQSFTHHWTFTVSGA
jgi:hypothetical protein